MSRRIHGFGLLEMVLALGLLALLLFFVGGGYQDFMARQRADALLSRVAGSINRARSDAVLQSRAIHVCAANLKQNLDVQGCLTPAASNGEYPLREGLLLFRDRPGGQAGRYDSKEAYHVIALGEGYAGYALTTSTLQFSLRANGTLSGGNVVLRLRRTDNQDCQQLLLNMLGQARRTPCA